MGFQKKTTTEKKGQKILVGQRKIHLGTVGWNYSDWQGSFYPDLLSPSDYLSFYSRQFESVEIPETFFGLPTPQKMLNWYQQTPAHFLFSLKMPRQISHEQRFKNSQKSFLQLSEKVLLLKEKLGVVIIQMPSSFQQKNVADLIKLLEKEYTNAFKIAVEFSSPIWKKTEAPAFFKAKNISIVQSDQHTLEDPGGNFLYFRWKGQQKFQTFNVEQRYCGEELKIWKLRFSQLSPRIRTIYGYFSNNYSGYAPGSCKFFSSLLCSETGERR